MGLNRTFIHFLSAYILGVSAHTLLITLSIWILLKQYGNQWFTLSGLAALIIVTGFSMRFSHYLDKLSRKYLILSFYAVNGLVLLIALLWQQTAWLSVIIVVTFQLSVNVFYTGFYAMAQHFTRKDYHRLNALMEVSGQLSSLVIGVFIYFTIQHVDMTWLLWACWVLIVLAGVTLLRVCETCLTDETSTQQARKLASKQSLNWFFTHPIAWLSVLSAFPYLIVMAMNQVQPIYFYQLLNLQPDAMALSSISYVLGTLLGSYLAGRFDNYTRRIMQAFVLTALGTVALATMPREFVFYVAMLVFGIANSSARVASASLTMQHLPNHHMATFNGLKNSITFIVRLVFLLALNGLFPLFDYHYVVYLLPALMIYAPICRLFLRHGHANAL